MRVEPNLIKCSRCQNVVLALGPLLLLGTAARYSTYGGGRGTGRLGDNFERAAPIMLSTLWMYGAAWYLESRTLLDFASPNNLGGAVAPRSLGSSRTCTILDKKSNTTRIC